MKLFWKIFFSTMFVSIFCFALGGYILIQSNFFVRLNHECDAAYNQNEIVAYALMGEFSEEILNKDMEKESVSAVLRIAAKDISVFQSGNELKFVLLNKEKDVLYSSIGNAPLSAAVLEQVSKNQCAYTITSVEDRFQIQAVIPVSIGGENYYVATYRDITMLYRNQSQQLHMLLGVMCGMLLLSGVMTYLLIRFLFGRITRLTHATTALANGKLDERVKISGHDEITMLSQNFNQMADDLQAKIGELQENAERQERFVGAFAHELKTPLTSIIGYADILRGKPPSQERIQMCADYIFNEGKRLESLSMRLLDLIVIKNQNLCLQNVEISMLFEEIKISVIPQLEMQGIKSSWNVHSGTILMEPNLMKNVFLNLLDNARKAIDQTGNIIVYGQWEEEYYAVRITDDGRGMSVEELDKIREAFYMADKSRSRKQGGAGLGLAICDEILEAHGFSIQFLSQVNCGTTVIVKMRGKR